MCYNSIIQVWEQETSHMELTEKTVEQNVLFEGVIIRVRKDQAELPNGHIAGRP